MSRLLGIILNASEMEGLAGFAKALGKPWDAICLTGKPSNRYGSEKVFLADLDDIPPADGLAKGLLSLCEGYDCVAAVSTMASKDLLPRLNALLRGVMVTDVVAVGPDQSFKRPVVAGSAIATVQVSGNPVLLTIRPAGFSKPEADGAPTCESITLDCPSKARRIAASGKSGGRPDLTQAKVVVSGGRPLKDAETFEKIIGGLADKLGGAVGATRAAVDSGIAPNDCQVGQTGKIVAPDLYIAAGISGSTQHMAGIKDSKVIVAVNKDPDAPIFESADIGIVADLFEVLPGLAEKL